MRRWSELDLDWSESAPGLFSVTLPGTRKISTECALEVGAYGVSVRAFVARRPDENAGGGLPLAAGAQPQMYGVAFSLDALGDIYLTGRLALAGRHRPRLDRCSGRSPTTADDSAST